MVRELGDFYYLIWVFALLVLGALSRLRQSKVGRAWLAIREDEVAAGNMGVPVFPTSSSPSRWPQWWPR